MDQLLNIVKQVAPALLGGLTGGAGPMVISAIAKKIGVGETVAEVTQALTANPELQLKLREIDAREFEIEQKGVSDRWQADMASDSWLSKNIRPMTLIYLLTAYLLMAVADGAGFHISESYVTLLGQWGMLVMGAYFGGRTVEKIASTMEKRK